MRLIMFKIQRFWYELSLLSLVDWLLLGFVALAAIIAVAWYFTIIAVGGAIIHWVINNC